MADVFVSYSRRDSEFVRRLASSMTEHGKEIWVDTEGIADGEVFPEAIKRAIEQSDAFLFVITPASVASAYCENEVEYARELQKRIVPVLRDPVSDAELPAEIRDRNWIPFTESDEFDASLGRLVAALDTDLEAAKAHTRWLVKALEWEAEGRDRSFLLRGSELKAAEAWLAASPESADPAPTSLQREYLLASREAAARRQRMLVGASVVVAAVSVGLLVFALISRSQAVSEQVSARAQALSAESQSELPDDPEISLILGMRAVREKPTPQSLFALRAALDASPLERAFPTLAASTTCGLNTGLTAALNPAGTQIAEGTCGGELVLLNEASGRVVHSMRLAQPVVALTYSPTGSLLAVGTTTKILLVDARSGTIVQARNALTTGRIVVSGVNPGIVALAFSPDGRELAANDMAGVKLWSVPGLAGRQLARDPGVGDSMVFTANARELLVGGATDGSVNVYALPGGRLVHRISGGGTNGSPVVLALSRDGSELAVGYPSPINPNGIVSLFSAKSWKKQFDLASIANVAIASVSFSPDGTRLAIGAEDGTAGVWSLSTREELVSYAGPTAAVTSMAFVPGGESVLTASNDGVLRLWRASGDEQAFVPLAANIDDVSVASRLLSVVADTGGTVWFYRFRLPGGQSLGRWRVGSGAKIAGLLSDDGRFGVTYAPPSPETGVPVVGPVHIWNAAERRVVKTLPPAGVFAASLSPDDSRLFLQVQSNTFPPNGIGIGEVVNLASGHTVQLQTVTPCGSYPQLMTFSANDKRIAGRSFCGIVDVWNADTGRLVREVDERGEVSSVDLTPDGSRLLVGSWDSRATIWSVASGKPLHQLIGHTRGINGASFAAGGSLVVTSSLDHTVRVWDAGSGKQLRVLSFSNFQGTMATSATGGLLAIGENAVVPGVEDVVRVFDTCPACTNAKALLRLAAPHVPAANRLTTLEHTVVDAA